MPANNSPALVHPVEGVWFQEQLIDVTPDWWIGATATEEAIQHVVRECVASFCTAIAITMTHVFVRTDAEPDYVRDRLKAPPSLANDPAIKANEEGSVQGHARQRYLCTISADDNGGAGGGFEPCPAKAALRQERDRLQAEVERLRGELDEANVEIEALRGPICDRCGCAFDSTTCWCGDGEHASHDGHYFVPMGCNCSRADFVPNKARARRPRLRPRRTWRSSPPRFGLSASRDRRGQRRGSDAPRPTWGDTRRSGYAWAPLGYVVLALARGARRADQGPREDLAAPRSGEPDDLEDHAARAPDAGPALLADLADGARIHRWGPASM